MKCINQQSGNNWHLFNGDCVEVSRGLPDESVHLSVFSPPFSSLYTYSNSERDMGNCKDDESFFTHFGFLIDELMRVTKPGRICAIHCMDLPSSKQTHGVIGLRDFSGDILRAFEARGWIYHSKVTIWKDPVTAMQRTKALGLLHKQIKKDSCMSRQGIPDSLLVMRKPGVNPEPVTHTNETFPVERWQRFASPVWASLHGVDDRGFSIAVSPSNGVPDKCGIDAGYTLQRESARDERDERHICPLQLEVIERAVELWSNPGDVVFSPFAGIGSEGYQSIAMGRKYVGIELKPSYYKVACQNLEFAEAKLNESTLIPV
jgi:DNA modification methylase